MTTPGSLVCADWVFMIKAMAGELDINGMIMENLKMKKINTVKGVD